MPGIAISAFRIRIPSFAWALLFLASIELLLRFWIAWPNEDLSTPSYRNDFPYRGWPEYVSQREGQKDLILIGNSQGVGAEFPRVEDIYAHKLYHTLKAADPQIRLHNWSQLGVLTHQLAILTDRALRPPPRAILMLVSLANFNPHSTDLLGRDATDIPLILGADRMLGGAGIPGLLETRLDARLTYSFQNFSDIGRSRTAFQDMLAEKLPVRHHRLVFGGRHIRSARIPLHQRPKRSDTRIQRPLQVPMDHERWETQFRQKQLPEALGFYRWLHARLTPLNTRLVWVWMPHGNRANETAALSAMRSIKQEFCQRLIADGHQCEDLDGKLPMAAFLNQDVASHLSRTGHDLMAEMLTPIIINGLH